MSTTASKKTYSQNSSMQDAIPVMRLLERMKSLYLRKIIAAPRRVSTAPVMRPTVRLFTLFAAFADRSDAIVATGTETIRASRCTVRIPGAMRKWLTEAMRAVSVMMKVLVPTALLRSIPSKRVKTISIIIPPPVPTKPVPNPMVRPKKRERTMSFELIPFLPFSVSALPVSGFRRNLIPIKKVRKSEKDPRTTPPAMYAAAEPRTHIETTETSMIQPRRRLMLPFLQ